MVDLEALNRVGHERYTLQLAHDAIHDAMRLAPPGQLKGMETALRAVKRLIAQRDCSYRARLAALLRQHNRELKRLQDQGVIV